MHPLHPRLSPVLPARAAVDESTSTVIICVTRPTYDSYEGWRELKVLHKGVKTAACLPDYTHDLEDEIGPLDKCVFKYAAGRHTPLITSMEWAVESSSELRITGLLRGYWASQYDVIVGGKFCIPIDPNPDDDTTFADDFVVAANYNADATLTCKLDALVAGQYNVTFVVREPSEQSKGFIDPVWCQGSVKTVTIGNYGQRIAVLVDSVSPSSERLLKKYYYELGTGAGLGIDALYSLIYHTEPKCATPTWRPCAYPSKAEIELWLGRQVCEDYERIDERQSPQFTTSDRVAQFLAQQSETEPDFIPLRRYGPAVSGFGAAFVEERTGATNTLPASDIVRINVDAASGTVASQYMLTVVPTIHDIQPRVSGDLGGHKVTISGSGFGDNTEGCATGDVVTKLAGIPCNVLSCSPSEIVCEVAPTPADPPEAPFTSESGLSLREWGVQAQGVTASEFANDGWTTVADLTTVEIGGLAMIDDAYCQSGLHTETRFINPSGLGFGGFAPTGNGCCDPACRVCGLGRYGGQKYNPALDDWGQINGEYPTCGQTTQLARAISPDAQCCIATREDDGTYTPTPEFERFCEGPHDVDCQIPGNKGRELKGQFVPKHSGMYSFWVQGAGNTKLYLNASGLDLDLAAIDAGDAAPIAESPLNTMKYHIFPSQESPPQYLEANVPCGFLLRQQMPKVPMVHPPTTNLEYNTGVDLERWGRNHLQVALRAIDPEPVSYDPEVAVPGQYHAVFQRLNLSTEMDTETEIHELRVVGVTSTTKLSFYVDDPHSGRKNTGGMWWNAYNDDGRDAEANAGNEGSNKCDTITAPYDNTDRTDRTCSRRWASVDDPSSSAWRGTMGDVYSCWKCWCHTSRGSYPANSPVNNECSQRAFGGTYSVTVTTDYDEVDPWWGSERVGTARIRVEFKSYPVESPMKLHIHEVGCTDVASRLETPLFGCTSDGQELLSETVIIRRRRIRYGQFRVHLDGRPTAWLSHTDIDSNGMAAALEQIRPILPTVNVLGHHGNAWRGKFWQLEFLRQGGAGYNVTVETVDAATGDAYLVPADLPAVVIEGQANGGQDWLLDPVPLHLFSPSTDNPSVLVVVDGIRSACSDKLDMSCGFDYDGSLTPTVTGITCVSGLCLSGNGRSVRGGDVFDLAGTGFVDPTHDVGSSAVLVLFGAGSCDVIQATASTIRCRLDEGAMDPTASVQVVSPHAGAAVGVPGDLYQYVGVIDAVIDELATAAGESNSFTAPISGGNVLTIQGTGFLTGQDNAVTIGGQPCAAVSASHSEIRCTTPAAAGLPDAVDVAWAPTAEQVFVGSISTTHGPTLARSWVQVPVTTAFEPLAFSAGVTTVVDIEGDFSGAEESPGCKHSLALVSATASRDCTGLVVTATAASCKVARGAPRHIAEQNSVTPQLKLCYPSGRTAYAFAVAAARTVDHALRVTSVNPISGSMVGGTLITIDGKGFASEADKLVVEGLTRDFEVASNQVDIITPHRTGQCRIVSSSLDRIVCVSSMFTEGGRQDADHHGHSGGGINGRVGVTVNNIAPLGLGSDPNGGSTHDEDDLLTAGEASGIIFEDGPSDVETPAALSDEEKRYQKTFCHLWILSHNDNICPETNVKLSAAAQAHAEDMAAMATLTHTGSDGRKVGMRVQNQSYPYALVEESIAYMPSQNGLDVVDHWRANSFDRAIMDNAFPREVGIGLFAGYFVVVYASPGPLTGAAPPAFQCQNRRRQADGSGLSLLAGPIDIDVARLDDLDVVPGSYAVFPLRAVGLDLELNVTDSTHRLASPFSQFGGGYTGQQVLIEGHRWFSGTVVGAAGSSVSFSVRASGEVVGTIRIPRDDAAPVVIAIARSMASVTAGFTENITMRDRSSHNHTDLPDAPRSNGRHRSARQTVEQKTCEVFIDADKWFYDQHGGTGPVDVRITNTILAMLDVMLEAIAAYGDVANFGLSDTHGPLLTVVGASVHTSESFGNEDPSYPSDSGSVLSQYRQFLAGDGGSTRSGISGDSVCLNHLFTHANFGNVVGLANLGSACQTDFSNVAFTSSMHQGGQMSLSGQSSTAIHEIGHNWGAPHDCSSDNPAPCEDYLLWWAQQNGLSQIGIEEECGAGSDHYVMFPSVPGGDNARRFSGCSKYEMKTVFEAVLINNPSCLKDGTSVTINVTEPSGPVIDTTASPAPTARLYHEYVDDGSTFTGEFDFLQVVTPTLGSISPASGVGGTLVTITGTLLDSAESVQIGSQNCTGLTPISASELQCTTPSLPAGRYHIRVRTTHGLAAHPPDHENEIVFLSELLFTGVEPRRGSWAGGLTVTVNGNGFGDDPEGVIVRFDGIQAVITAVSDTRVVLVVPEVEMPPAAPTTAPTTAPTAPTAAPIAPTQTPTEAPTAPTDAPTQAPTAPTAAPTQTPTAPSAAPTQAPTTLIPPLSIVAGPCAIDADGCATDGSGDSDHGNNERCTITVGDAGYLTSQGPFETETFWDYVTIGGDRYQGSTGPDGVAVAAGSNFTWQSDGSVTNAGWTICWTTLANRRQRQKRQRDNVDGEVSLLVSVRTDTYNGAAYGQRVEQRHSTGRLGLPENCLHCSLAADFAAQTTPRVDGHSGNMWLPSWYTTVSLSCTTDPVSNCRFLYERQLTPTVTSVSPSSGFAGDMVTVSGTGFSGAGDASGTQVEIGGASCTVTSYSDTELVCALGPAIGGNHPVYVLVSGYGLARADRVTFEADVTVDTIATAVPGSFDTHASFGGGDQVTLTGKGFGSDSLSTTVAFCGAPCAVLSSTYTSVTCRTSAVHSVTSIETFDNVEAAQLLPSEDDSLVLIADGAGASATAAFDNVYDSVYSSPGTGGICWVGIDAGVGRKMMLSRIRYHPANLITRSGDVYETPGGFAMRDGVFESSDSIDGPWMVASTIAAPHQGWNVIDIGAPDRTAARFVRYKNTASSDCHIAELDLIGVVVQAEDACAATVTTQQSTAHASLGHAGTAPSFTMTSTTTLAFGIENTPVVTEVTPRYGSSLGGTTVTITGTRFPLLAASTAVDVNGRPCEVLDPALEDPPGTWMDGTVIKCVTSRRGTFGPSGVAVRHASREGLPVGEASSGESVMSTSVRHCRDLDRWSLTNTWLHDEPPGAGYNVLVPLDQTLLYDEQAPPLGTIIVQGVLVFARKDLTLSVTNILVQGGKFEIGTEQDPFMEKATITLRGGENDGGSIPLLGKKMLAVTGGPGSSSSTFAGGAWASLRDVGELDIHGAPRADTWVKVAATISVGATTFEVATAVDFAPGEHIVVSSPPEQFTVASVLGTTITVTTAATSEHLSELRYVDGEEFDMRCEVGLLSRNVVIEGDAGTRTSQFGGHTMATLGSEYRIEHTELRNCGQAGRTGKHCIHMHQLGRVPYETSYVRGNSVHHGWNRAVVLSSTSEMDVSHNVAYFVEGHGFHQADGKSIRNAFDGNLGIATKKTLACGRSDCKPATFSVNSPENYFRFNIAADGDGNGFGWTLEPGSPETYLQLLEMYGNIGHHNAKFGLDTGKMYLPKTIVYMYNNTFHHNGVGGAYHKNLGNTHHVYSRFGLNGGTDLRWQGYSYGAPATRFNPQVRDSLFIGGNNEVGIWGPKGEYFLVSGAKFDGYGNTAAIMGCAACCCAIGPKQGAYTYRWEKLQFYNSPVRVGWGCPYKQIHFDIDGSLTGHVSGSVTAYKRYNDWGNPLDAPASPSSACSLPTGTTYSGGIVCNGSVRVRRLAVEGVNAGGGEPGVIDQKALWVKKSARGPTNGEETDSEIYAGPNWDMFGVSRTLFEGKCHSTSTFGYMRDNATKQYLWALGGYGDQCYRPDKPAKNRRLEGSDCSVPVYGTSTSVLNDLGLSLGLISNGVPKGTDALFVFEDQLDGTMKILTAPGVRSGGYEPLSQGGCGGRRVFNASDVKYWTCYAHANQPIRETPVSHDCYFERNPGGNHMYDDYVYNTAGKDQATFCSATGESNEVFVVEVVQNRTRQGEETFIRIKSTIDSGSYLGRPDNQFGGSYMWGKTQEDASIFGITQGAIANTDGCTDQDHLDSISFRSAGDGYGWALPVITGHDYFLDFGGIVDFADMQLRYSDPFYHTHYSTPDNDAVMLKFPYVNFRYRFEVQHDHLGSEVPWYDRFSSSCAGKLCEPAALGDSIERLARDDPIFGKGFMLREDESFSQTTAASSGSFGEWHVALNPNGVNLAGIPAGSADIFSVTTRALQCAPRMSCWSWDGIFDDTNTTIWQYSNASLWGAVKARWQARQLSDVEANPSGGCPVPGENVEIPYGFEVSLDVPPCSPNQPVTTDGGLTCDCVPKLGRLTVTGKLDFEDTLDVSLDADTILVWGTFQVGTRDSPFQHQARITLHGTISSNTLIVSDDHYLGNKVIAVFGDMLLYGQPIAVDRAKLAAPAAPGDTYIVLDRAVAWEGGSTIVLAPTGTDPFEIETVVVTTVLGDGKTLVLASPLLNPHTAATTQLSGREVIMAGDVGLLSGRTIILVGNMDVAEVDAGHGFHMVVGEHRYQSGDTDPAMGRLVADQVEFRHCGKTNTEHPCLLFRYFTPLWSASRYAQFASWLFGDQQDEYPSNRVTSSALRDTKNGGLYGINAGGLVFEDNIVHNTYGFGIKLDEWSNRALVRGNLIVGVFRVPDEENNLATCLADQSCLIKPFSAMYLLPDSMHIFADNTIAGSQDTGITTYWDRDCNGEPIINKTISETMPDYASRYSGNEIYGTMVGLRLLPSSSGLSVSLCVGVADLKVWQISHVGIVTLDQLASVELDNVTVADSHVGISLNSIRSGSEHVFKVLNSVIMGTTRLNRGQAGSAPCAAYQDWECRAYGQYNTLAAFCDSVFGDSVRRIGIAVPRYTNQAKTCGTRGESGICRPVTRPAKQCAVPMLGRYGRVQARRAELHISNTIFHGFFESDCGKDSRALSVLPDEGDFVPDIYLNAVTWHETDQRAKMLLGVDPGRIAKTGLSGGKCESLCDAVMAAVVHESAGEGLFAGAIQPVQDVCVSGNDCVLVGGQRATSLGRNLAQCAFDDSTKSYVCASGTVLAHAVLLPYSWVSPVAITRSRVDGTGQASTYGSAGSTKEGCSGEAKSPVFPFKILVSDDHVHTVRAAGQMPNSGKILWYPPSQNSKAVVRIFFAEPYSQMKLYGDFLSLSELRIDDEAGTVPTASSPTGSWSYYPATRLLTIVMGAAHDQYEWLGAVRMAVDVEMAVLVDIPPETPIETKTEIVEAYAQRMLLSLMALLNNNNQPDSLAVNLSVVCVHFEGEPCLKNGGARRRRARRTTDTGEPLRIQLESHPPNEGELYGEDKTPTAAFYENRNTAEAIVRQTIDLVSDGIMSELLVNATDGYANLGVGQLLGVVTESESTEDLIQQLVTTEGVFNSISFVGTVLEDADGANGLTDGAVTALGSVRVTIIDPESDQILQETTTDAGGAWAIDSLPEAGSYIVEVDVASLPSTSHQWRAVGEGNRRSFVNVSSVETTLTHRFQQWRTLNGQVVDGVAVGLEAVGVEVSSVYSGVPTTVLTDSAGGWSVAVPLGDATVDVIESTLPFLQPYNEAATSGNDPQAVPAAASTTTIVTSFSRLAQATGTVSELTFDLSLYVTSGQTDRQNVLAPAQGATVEVVGSDGKARRTTTNADGYWELGVPAGSVTATIIDVNGGNDCIMVDPATYAPAPSSLQADATTAEPAPFATFIADCLQQCTPTSCSVDNMCMSIFDQAVCVGDATAPSPSPIPSPTPAPNVNLCDGKPETHYCWGVRDIWGRGSGST